MAERERISTIAVDEATGVPLLRTSERNDFKRCPFLWEQTWLRGLRSRREPTWAWFGTAIHKGLEARYPVGSKRGKVGDMHDAFDEALNQQERRIFTEGSEVDPEAIVDGRSLGHAMLDGYVAEYGKDSHWQVLHTEQPFQIEVPHPTNPNSPLVIYAGTWDLAVWDKVEKCFKIVDHKTRKSFPSNWAFYGINDQAGSYLWVAKEVLVFKGILKKKDSIEGLVFNALKKSMPDPRPINPATGQACNKPTKQHYLDALGYSAAPRGVTVETLAEQAEDRGIKVYGDPSSRQPMPLFHREEIPADSRKRVAQARKVQAEALAMAEYRAGRLPVFKVPTEECVRCPIFEFCELHDTDPEEAEEFAKVTMVTRDPYRDHREDFAASGVRV
jgi:hypothetical protein